MGQNISFAAKSQKDLVEQMHLERQHSPYLNDKYVQSDAVCKNLVCKNLIKKTQNNNKKWFKKEYIWVKENKNKRLNYDP